MALTRQKRNRLIFLSAYVLAACLAVLAMRPYYFYSILIVLGPPTVANFLWLKRSRWKVFLFSLLAAALFAPPIELVTRLADAWDVQSIFPRPFGLVPWENMLFAFINFFWVLAFYEYFVDRDTDPRIDRKLRWLVGLYVIFAAAAYSVFFFDRHLATTSYAKIAALILILPGCYIFAQRPRLLKKTLLPTAFFAFVFFVYEMVSLYVGSWWWPGDYVYAVAVFGKPFPLDDVIIWYFLSTPVLIGGYEFFADDFK